MTELQEYKTICLQLRTENQILRAEKEEAEEREARLKRQIQIIAQLHPEGENGPSSMDSMQGQIDRLRQEVVGLIGEREQLEIVNRTYVQKIEDLKYHNGQLKSLNEKMSQLHARQIDMMRREAVMPERLRELGEREQNLKNENQLLEKRLNSVAEVARELENFYMGEIRKKNELLKQKDEDLQRMAKDLQGAKTHRFQQNEMARQVNQKWEKAMASIQEQHQAQVAELKSKIKFLINKIEMQDEGSSKPSLGSISVVSDMVQSKMIQSSSSVDSFRVGPASLIVKDQHLTRRNTSGAKTPSKYGRGGKVPLIERNY